MMDRLTEWTGLGAIALKYQENFDMSEEDFAEYQKVLNKLAHYEDLEEAGRLIELPCAVGDTVWEVRWWDEVTESKVIDGKTYFRKVRKRKVTKTQFSLFDYNDFGKIVFLTKAEAEAALKERESE